MIPYRLSLLVPAAALLLFGCYSDIAIGTPHGDSDVGDDDDTLDDDDTAAPDDDDTAAPDDDDTLDDDDTSDDDDTVPSDDDDTSEPGDAYCYTEPGVDPSASLSDLQSSYSPWSWQTTALEVTDRRYPSGNLLLSLTQNDPWFGAFVDSSSWTSLMDSLMTIHHEQTHYYDYSNALFPVHFGYFVREDWQPQLTFREGFPRSEILGMLPDNSTALYSSTYLVGDQGTYGFMELLDEQNCYINGLAAIGLVGEFIPFGISARDGALAFTLYLELYLQRARTTYPALYADLCGDPELRDLILVQWLRMHYFLQFSDAFPNLGIQDAQIESHMYAPSLQSELEACVGYTLQASNCLSPTESWSPPW